ncbi:MAG TPA: hypothetical protein P5567_07425 [Kiritimatiellia bacterium]|nr:hypothetical protein [Kiritimatiellia bacterium]HRZ12271.1 hypothetical protein [Kiritimatiellia bacterium]HSA17971.1 hypothetical protein [Kiritimatiellia bacterium]
MKTCVRIIVPGLLLAASSALARPAAVDLGRWQTPIRNQGGRGNCFIHGTVAAMEAAYKRAGSGDLDLSELFSDYVGQVFFLETVRMDGHWYTSDMRVPGATERETSIQSDHAMSVESASPCMTLAIPEDRCMPYRYGPADLGEHADKNDPFWANQLTVSAFNLDPSNLPYSALSAPRYYRIRSIEWLPKDDARNPAAIEAVLAGGREVIWDFRMAGDISGKVWQYNGPAGDAYPHRMLIIGYNRTDARHPYFLVKNSWADVGVYDTRDCITRISYDYLQYGEWASYIKEIEPPRPWPELQFIGRWSLEMGPRRGLLDIYHLPGMMRGSFEHNQFRDEQGRPLEDRRLGTFYEKGDPNDAYRVNGIVRGHSIELYIDFSHPAARWDRLQGWKVSFTLNPRDPHRLIGRYDARDGRRGEARAERNRAPISPLGPRPPEEESQALLARDEMEKRKRWDAEAVERAELELKKQAEEALKIAENERLKKEANAPAADSPILLKWRELGGADGFLGGAQTEERACPDGRGHYIHFAGGSIYWTPETGAHAIYGAIREKWASLGWETCAFLGYPITDETGTPDGVGRFNHFEKGGSIYWTPETGAFEVHGPIRERWQALGWETGRLGYPVSDVEMADGKEGLVTRFQRGLIRWHPARGVTVETEK